VRSIVGVLSSSVSLHIPLSARLPKPFRVLLIFHLNRHTRCLPVILRIISSCCMWSIAPATVGKVIPISSAALAIEKMGWV
jgi:hypothetical protein